MTRRSNQRLQDEQMTNAPTIAPMKARPDRPDTSRPYVPENGEERDGGPEHVL